MKKLTALLLSVLLVFGLAACGSTNNSNNTSAAITSENTKNKATAPSKAKTGKTLVVYYSASGNTAGRYGRYR